MKKLKIPKKIKKQIIALALIADLGVKFYPYEDAEAFMFIKDFGDKMFSSQPIIVTEKFFTDMDYILPSRVAINKLVHDLYNYKLSLLKK